MKTLLQRLKDHVKQRQLFYLKTLLLVQLIGLGIVLAILLSLPVLAYIYFILLYAAYTYFKTILMTLTAIGRTIK
jgi:hypothetical protein